MFKSVPQILKCQKSSVLGLSRLRPQLLISHRAILNSLSQVAFKARFSTVQAPTQPTQESISQENISIQPENDQIRQKQNEVVQTINKEIKQNTNAFKNSVHMKKLANSLKSSGITLNYYDCLLFLASLQIQDPSNPLVKDFKNLYAQEKQLLREVLKESQLPEYLTSDYNVGKLLMFLTVNAKPERATVKEAENFNKILLNKPKDPLFMLDYFGFKYAVLTFVTPHSKPDSDVLDILKAYIISCKELDCFKDILKVTKKNDYKLTPFIERSLLSISNSLSSILQWDKSNFATFQPYFHWFLNLCTQICYLTQLGSKISARVLDLVFQIKESSLKVDLTQYGELILFAATDVNKNLHELTCERFTRLFFIYSRINFFHFSKSAYNDYINQAIVYIHEKQNEFNAEQWKSNLYAMGYNSILTPQVQDVYDNLLALDHLKQQRTYRKYPVYLKNLLLSALNNYALESSPRLDEIIQYLIKEVRMHEKGSPYYDLVSFMKIAQGLNRAECLNPVFWKACFDVLPEAVKNDGLQYDLLFMIKSFELFANHPESQEQYKEVYSLLQDFIRKHRDTYDKISSFDVQELAQKLPDAHESVSALQHQISLLLKKLDFAFEEEAKANFMVVDFLIPSKNMILELQGPTHYLKPDLNRMNRVTEFKNKCLEKMGYKVISVPFNSVSTDETSLDYFIMQALEKSEQTEKKD